MLVKVLSTVIGIELGLIIADKRHIKKLRDMLDRSMIQTAKSIVLAKDYEQTCNRATKVAEEALEMLEKISR